MGEIGQVAELRVPIVTNDPANHRQLSLNPWMSEEGIQAFAGFPMVVGEQLLGVLAIYHRRPLDRNTIELLTLFAQHAATAIQEAHLFHLATEQTARLGAVNAELETRQPAQGGVPGEYEPRAPHPAEFDPRLLPAAARGRRRHLDPRPAPGRGHHRPERTAPAGAHQRPPGYLQARGGESAAPPRRGRGRAADFGVRRERQARWPRTRSSN